MKRTLHICLLFLLFCSLSFAQQMPIDFATSEDTFTAFSGTTFGLRGDPSDGSNQVGEFGNNGGDANQGAFIDLIRDVDLGQGKVIDLRFYSFDPNAHAVKIKLEQGSNPDVEVSVNVNSGNGATWQNLSFDFANAQLSSDGTPIDATGTYRRVTIFVDFGVTQAGTYLFDDIDDGSTPTDPNALDVIYNDLVWSDEFDYTGAVDNTKWHHQTFGPNGGQWFNGELQHYTDSQDNSFVQNGFLNIVAKRETTTQNGVTLDFTSARLNSKFAFTHGRVDVRAQLPEGNGTWPAIWTLGKNVSEPGAWFETQGFGTTAWPACGELDIMEHGLHATNEVSSAIHTPSSSGATVNTATQTLPDVANNFHVYSMNWSPNQVTFMIDGVGYYTYNPAVKDGSTWPFDLDQFLLLNVAMGGFAGNVDAGFTQSSMIIDYVRVYQNVVFSTEDVFANKFSIYPNPVSDRIHINTDERIDRQELYNSLGQLVLKREDNQPLEVDNLRTGLYFLKIKSGNRGVTKKVIIN